MHATGKLVFATPEFRVQRVPEFAYAENCAINHFYANFGTERLQAGMIIIIITPCPPWEEIWLIIILLLAQTIANMDVKLQVIFNETKDSDGDVILNDVLKEFAVKLLKPACVRVDCFNPGTDLFTTVLEDGFCHLQGRAIANDRKLFGWSVVSDHLMKSLLLKCRAGLGTYLLTQPLDLVSAVLRHLTRKAPVIATMIITPQQPTLEHFRLLRKQLLPWTEENLTTSLPGGANYAIISITSTLVDELQSRITRNKSNVLGEKAILSLLQTSNSSGGGNLPVVTTNSGTSNPVALENLIRRPQRHIIGGKHGGGNSIPVMLHEHLNQLQPDSVSIDDIFILHRTRDAIDGIDPKLARMLVEAFGNILLFSQASPSIQLFQTGGDCIVVGTNFVSGGINSANPSTLLTHACSGESSETSLTDLNDEYPGIFDYAKERIAGFYSIEFLKGLYQDPSIESIGQLRGSQVLSLVNQINSYIHSTPTHKELL
jgi:hypothetical protein